MEIAQQHVTSASELPAMLLERAARAGDAVRNARLNDARLPVLLDRGARLILASATAGPSASAADSWLAARSLHRAVLALVGVLGSRTAGSARAGDEAVWEAAARAVRLAADVAAFSEATNCHGGIVTAWVKADPVLCIDALVGWARLCHTARDARAGNAQPPTSLDSHPFLRYVADAVASAVSSSSSLPLSSSVARGPLSSVRVSQLAALADAVADITPPLRRIARHGRPTLRFYAQLLPSRPNNASPWSPRLRHALLESQLPRSFGGGSPGMIDSNGGRGGIPVQPQRVQPGLLRSSLAAIAEAIADEVATRASAALAKASPARPIVLQLDRDGTNRSVFSHSTSHATMRDDELLPGCGLHETARLLRALARAGVPTSHPVWCTVARCVVQRASCVIAGSMSHRDFDQSPLSALQAAKVVPIASILSTFASLGLTDADTRRAAVAVAQAVVDAAASTPLVKVAWSAAPGPAAAAAHAVMTLVAASPPRHVERAATLSHPPTRRNDVSHRGSSRDTPFPVEIGRDGTMIDSVRGCAMCSATAVRASLTRLTDRNDCNGKDDINEVASAASMLCFVSTAVASSIADVLAIPSHSAHVNTVAAADRSFAYDIKKTQHLVATVLTTHHIQGAVPLGTAASLRTPSPIASSSTVSMPWLSAYPQRVPFMPTAEGLLQLPGGMASATSPTAVAAVISASAVVSMAHGRLLALRVDNCNEPCQRWMNALNRQLSHALCSSVAIWAAAPQDIVNLAMSSGSLTRSQRPLQPDATASACAPPAILVSLAAGLGSRPLESLLDTAEHGGAWPDHGTSPLWSYTAPQLAALTLCLSNSGVNLLGTLPSSGRNDSFDRSFIAALCRCLVPRLKIYDSGTRRSASAASSQSSSPVLGRIRLRDAAALLYCVATAVASSASPATGLRRNDVSLLLSSLGARTGARLDRVAQREARAWGAAGSVPDVDVDVDRGLVSRGGNSTVVGTVRRDDVVGDEANWHASSGTSSGSSDSDSDNDGALAFSGAWHGDESDTGIYRHFGGLHGNSVSSNETLYTAPVTAAAAGSHTTWVRLHLASVILRAIDGDSGAFSQNPFFSDDAIALLGLRYAAATAGGSDQSCNAWAQPTQSFITDFAAELAGIAPVAASDGLVVQAATIVAGIVVDITIVATRPSAVGSVTDGRVKSPIDPRARYAVMGYRCLHDLDPNRAGVEVVLQRAGWQVVWIDEAPTPDVTSSPASLLQWLVRVAAPPRV